MPGIQTPESDQEAPSLDVRLAELVREYYADPLGFVLFAFPWGHGPLAGFRGPDRNQARFLEDLGQEVRARGFRGDAPVMPVMMSVTSGHGTGKSALAAWIVGWIASTRPHSIGTITAGTYHQLRSRTWAAVRKWFSMMVTGHWFDLRADGLYRKGAEATWKCEIQTCRPENAQAFAGQHAVTSTSYYIFDEAALVPDEVWQVALGGLTDGEPMIFAWGQCSRNTGAFYRINFGSERHRWNTRRWDSRSGAFTNKQYIEQLIADYGEDSEVARVRILGLPPRTSEFQYIDQERIRAAQEREWHGIAMPDEPLICGFDVSGGGGAWNVFRFRRGYDARSMPPIRLKGELARTPGVLVAKAAELLAERHPGRHIAAMFVDSAFGAEIVARLQMLGHKNVFAINFGDPSPEPNYLNMRAYMYAKCKDWLEFGCIPPDPDPLGYQLGVPGMHHNQSGKLVIESKQSIQQRGEESPDDADALVLTFARSVAPNLAKSQTRIRQSSGVLPGYESGGSIWS